MKIRFHSMVLSGMVAATAAISIPQAGADDAAVPGWRRGPSSWNGTGYELPKQVPTPWKSFQSTESATAASDKELEEKPYTVPTGPQPNPHFDADLGRGEKQPGPEVGVTSSSVRAEDPVSDLFGDPLKAKICWDLYRIWVLLSLSN